MPLLYPAGSTRLPHCHCLQHGHQAWQAATDHASSCASCCCEEATYVSYLIGRHEHKEVSDNEILGLTFNRASRAIRQGSCKSGDLDVR